MVEKPRPYQTDFQRMRQVRRVAAVLVATMALWMGAQFLGGQLGLETRFVFLFDLSAIAGFRWALVVTYRIWRGSRG
jgi:hypothetical protein